MQFYFILILEWQAYRINIVPKLKEKLMELLKHKKRWLMGRLWKLIITRPTR